MAMCRMILAYNLTSIGLTDGDVKNRFRRVGNIALLAVNLLNGLAFHIVVKPNLFFSSSIEIFLRAKVLQTWIINRPLMFV